MKRIHSTGKAELREHGMKTDNKVATGLVGTAKPYVDKVRAWAGKKGEEWAQERAKNKAVRTAYNEASYKARLKYASKEATYRQTAAYHKRIAPLRIRATDPRQGGLARQQGMPHMTNAGFGTPSNNTKKKKSSVRDPFWP
jgi:hypothetical protein